MAGQKNAGLDFTPPFLPDGSLYADCLKDYGANHQGGEPQNKTKKKEAHTSTRESSFHSVGSVAQNATYEAALKADEVGSMPHTAPSCAMLFANDPKELAHSVRARLSTPMLGFNPKECHSGILLYEKNHCAIREEAKGLYKSVRSLLPVQEERAVYFEMFIAKQVRIPRRVMVVAFHFFRFP